MNKPIPETPTSTSAFGHADYSFVDLIQEMKSLGMDPKPILETAANDIFSIHGPKVFAYARIMLENMVKTDNPNGIYLWNEILNILSQRISPAPAALH